MCIMNGMSKEQSGLEEFFRTYPELSFKKNDIIVEYAEPANYILYISRGEVRQVDITATGNELTLNVLKTGALISLPWVFKTDNSLFSFRANNDVVIRKAPVVDVKKFIEENPEIPLQILKRVSRGLDGVLLRLGAHMGHQAASSVRVELYLEAIRFGRHDKENKTTVSIPVNDLASRSGLARETVSRQLSSLAETGLIVRKGKTIIIPDPAKLIN